MYCGPAPRRHKGCSGRLWRRCCCRATPQRFREEVDKLHQEAQASGKYALYEFIAYDRDVGSSEVGISKARSDCPRFPLWRSYDW
eukprot:1239915-Ditylum_brightwellii.AAC.1